MQVMSKEVVNIGQGYLEFGTRVQRLTKRDARRPYMCNIITGQEFTM